MDLLQGAMGIRLSSGDKSQHERQLCVPTLIDRRPLLNVSLRSVSKLQRVIFKSINFNPRRHSVHKLRAKEVVEDVAQCIHSSDFFRRSCRLGAKSNIQWKSTLTVHLYSNNIAVFRSQLCDPNRRCRQHVVVCVFGPQHRLSDHGYAGDDMETGGVVRLIFGTS